MSVPPLFAPGTRMMLIAVSLLSGYKDDQAQNHLAIAASMHRETEMPLWLEKPELLLGRRAKRPPDSG